MPVPRFWTRAAGRSSRAHRRRSGTQIAPSEASKRAPQEVKELVHKRWSWAIGVVLIALVVAVLAAGYYQEFYKPPRVWAGRVNDVEFTMRDLVQRIRVEQGITGEVDLARRPFEYLKRLLNAEVLRQAAPGLGIHVTDELVNESLKDRHYPSTPAGQATDPGQLDQEYRENLQTYLTRTELSESEYRGIVEEHLRETFLYVLLGQGIEEMQEQVEVEWIRLEPDGQVTVPEVMDRLGDEEFSSVARNVGVSKGFADESGYVGWLPRKAFPEISQVLFGDPATVRPPLGVGEIGGPIYTPDDVYIVRKLSGVEKKPLSDRMGKKVNAQALKDWQDQRLNDGMAQKWVKMRFDSKYYEWVTEQVLIAKPLDTPGLR